MPNLMLVAVFLFCRSITLDNRNSTVDVYYLQPLCKGWFSVFAFAMWLQMLMLVLLPYFNFCVLSNHKGFVKLFVSVGECLIAFGTFLVLVGTFLVLVGIFLVLVGIFLVLVGIFLVSVGIFLAATVTFLVTTVTFLANVVTFLLATVILLVFIVTFFVSIGICLPQDVIS